MQYFLFRAFVPVRNTGWVHWLTSTPTNRSSSKAHRKPLVAAKCRIEFAKAYISHSYSWMMPTATVESKCLGPRWSKSTQRQFFHKSAIFVCLLVLLQPRRSWHGCLLWIKSPKNMVGSHYENRRISSPKSMSTLLWMHALHDAHGFIPCSCRLREFRCCPETMSVPELIMDDCSTYCLPVSRMEWSQATQTRHNMVWTQKTPQQLILD